MKRGHQVQISKKNGRIIRAVTAANTNHGEDDDKDLAVHIGKRLRELRLFHDVTQTQLGEMLGVTFQQVQKYERGTNNINAIKLLDCARALNVNINYFFEGFSKQEKRQGSDRQARNADLAAGASAPTDQLYQIVGMLSRIKDPAVMTALIRLTKSLSANGLNS